MHGDVESETFGAKNLMCLMQADFSTNVSMKHTFFSSIFVGWKPNLSRVRNQTRGGAEYGWTLLKDVDKDR